jgi:hypothetical protein
LRSIFILFLFIAGAFLFASNAEAATTYYVWANGGHTACAASDKTAAQTNDQSHAFNMTGINLCSGANALAAGDQVLFSSAGGNFSTLLTIPSGGSGAGNEITYANVPTETPVVAITSGYLIDTNSKSNIVIQGLTANYTGTSASTNIGIVIGAGSNIQFKYFTSDMGGFGYNIWSNVVLSNIVLDHVTLTNCRAGTLMCLFLPGSSNSNVTISNLIATNISISNAVTASITNSTFTGSITIGTGSNITINNIPSTAGMSLSNITTGTISNATSTGVISVSTGSNITINNIPSTAGISLSGVTTGTVSNVVGSGGATGFYFTNSSDITVNDSSMTGSSAYGAFQAGSFAGGAPSHDITYNRVTANNNSGIGFVAQDTSYNITYNNCRADNNGSLGFAPLASANNVTYWRSEASYNGIINNTSNGGGFLPHDSVTNIKCYYCITHHNYNEGYGDVSNGINAFYNLVSYSNGNAVGDVFNGSTVTTASIRANNYYNKHGGGNLTLQNGIFGGNGKPREILNTTPATAIFNYNLYKPLDDNNFYNTANDANNKSWATYHLTNETNSQNTDPLFTNGTGSYSTSTDFQLSALSPAIDTGTTASWMTSTTTDFSGNPIYGTPDIGAYEYQPPFTLGTSLVDPTGNIRIYGDKKYRYTTATSSTMRANFSVAPREGSWSYSASTTRPEWLNISNITWNTSGTYSKAWTASSTTATTTVFTIGDLRPNANYTIAVDGLASTTQQSNGSGVITYTYTGGYSTHTFTVTDTAGPASFTTSLPANGVTTDNKPSFSWNASSDSGSGLSKYTLYIDGTIDTDSIGTTVTSITPTNSFACGNHTWYVRATDVSGNTTDSNTSNFGVGCSSGGGSSAANRVSNLMAMGQVDEAQKVAKQYNVKSIPEKTAPIIAIKSFTRTLRQGMTGNDIKNLQIYLNSKGFAVSIKGAGSPGHETTFFGPATKAALIRFQEANEKFILKPLGLTYGTGFFGDSTMKFIRENY